MTSSGTTTLEQELREINEALLISSIRQHELTEQATAAEALLRATERDLERELDATRRLQQISTQLIHENDVETLYGQILDAAVAIMRSEMASMQIVDASQDALRLTESRGFAPEFDNVFEFVQRDTKTVCGVAMRTGRRVVVPDVERWDLIAGTPALDDLRTAGIRAVQSTPLVTRRGDLIGMISTHWRQPHQPSQAELRVMDVLARQTADLIERAQTEHVGAMLAAVVESSEDAIISKDLGGLITSWNQGAEHLYGYTVDEVMGQPVSLLIPEGQSDEEPQIVARIRDGEVIEHYETVRRRKDGSLVEISLTVSPIRGAAGQVVGASNVARDVTERRRSEAALHASEDRYRTLFETVAVSLWDEDFSAVKRAIDGLKAEGVTDFARYFGEHPEFVEQAMGMIRVLDVNEATVELFEAQDKSELLGSLPKIFQS